MEITKEIKQKLILLVDDAASMRNMIKAILRDSGFTKIFEAPNGKESQTILEKKKMDLVLCDWNMPVMNGLDLFKNVRQSENLKDLPFLMLTAESQSTMVKEAFAAGVSDYVVKPFTSECLLKKGVTRFGLLYRLSVERILSFRIV